MTSQPVWRSHNANLEQEMETATGNKIQTLLKNNNHLHSCVHKHIAKKDCQHWSSFSVFKWVLCLHTVQLLQILIIISKTKEFINSYFGYCPMIYKMRITALGWQIYNKNLDRKWQPVLWPMWEPSCDSLISQNSNWKLCWKRKETALNGRGLKKQRK